MAEESDEDTQSEAPSAASGAPKVGTGFAGETTGSFPASHADADETLVAPAAENEKIGDFEVLGKLGQGGMGAVYRARQISLDRVVALKILPATLEADAEFVTRFQREARIAASLSHANLVKIYSSGLADGCHFIAMELIEGETLGQFVRRGPLPPPEALRICLDVAKALQCGWDRAQLIHRDIKPGNIFLSNHGEVKVGDLGLAKSMAGDTTGLTNTGTAMGTPHYISPEQAKGEKDLDFRADIYSLGCTLYQMLTGRTPYQGSDPVSVMHQHIHGPPPAILKVLPQCPIPLVRLVGKMLKKIKRERQGSYPELIAEIQRVQALFAPEVSALESTMPPDPEATFLETPISATPVSAPVVVRRPRTKSKALLFGGAAAVIVVIALLAYLLRPKDEQKLTKAEVYAQEHAGQPLVRPTESAALTVVAAKSAILVPSAIKVFNTPATIPQGPGSTWENEAMRLDKRGAGLPSLRLRDCILRASVLMNPDANVCTLQLRHSQDASNRNSAYLVTVAQRGGGLILSAAEKDTDREIRRWKLPRPYSPDEWLRVEFKVAGDELSVSADGILLGQEHDTAIPGPAAFQVYAKEKGYFRDIEYVPLDGAASAAMAAPGEPWQDMLNDTAKLGLSNGAEAVAKGLQLPVGGYATVRSGRGSLRDGAIRVRSLLGEPHPQIRARATEEGTYCLEVRDSTTVVLSRNDPPARANTILKEYKLTTPLTPDAEYEMELRVEGKGLTAILNHTVIGVVTDAKLPQGSFGVASVGRVGPPCLATSLGFLDLDAAALSGASTAATSAVQGDGRDWVVQRRQGKHVFSTPSLADDGVRLRFTGNASLHVSETDFYDGAIKATWAFPQGSTFFPTLALRSNPESGAYQAVLMNDGIRLQRYQPAGADHAEKWIQLGKWPYPPGFRMETEFAFELRSNDDLIAVLLNDRVVGTARDQTLRGAGKFTFLTPAGTVMRKMEYTGSQQAAGASAATKDAPFVNSLGMKFVPVPITGGPTSGQRVLFSIWETRVQDYELFATETAHPWAKADFIQTPLHPAVGVSWEDGVAFCEWLTERERKAGKLDANHAYRLPSDHEWSCAVGIGDQEDSAKSAKEKAGKFPEQFPWGTAWPPPAGAGNFKGAENKGGIAGYSDGFEKTAPVGSFPPDAFGLYDLAGNVWEWCLEENLDAAEKTRVLRGGSHDFASRGMLQSTARPRLSSNYHGGGQNGFRVVLAPAQ